MLDDTQVLNSKEREFNFKKIPCINTKKLISEAMDVIFEN